MFALLKLILNFFSGDPTLPLTAQVEPSPSNKKIFLQLSAWDDKLLSTSKMTTFVEMLLCYFLFYSIVIKHKPALSNVIR